MTLCRETIETAESAHRIPRQLLSAISLVESGRWHSQRKESLAWPWTVTSGENSWYLNSKDEAIRKVEELRKRGVRNIDVGCMQINLYYHPTAFEDLDEAFEPESNVAYAARFLTQLREDKGSWNDAIAHYHSANRVLNRPYFEKVYEFWRRERQRDFEERQKIAAEKRQRMLEERAARLLTLRDAQRAGAVVARN